MRNDLMWKIYYFYKYLRNITYNSIRRPDDYRKRKQILELLKTSDNPLIQEICEYFYVNRLTAFPYWWTNEYQGLNFDVDIYKDSDGYVYSYYHGKKMYGKKGWKKRHFKSYYKGLLLEQDTRSPHCYFIDGQRSMKPNSIVADIGAAEGIFGLEVIENCRKLYIFECDNDWIEPLRRTFKPWQEKVEIVEKFIGDTNNGDMVTIDEFFSGKELDAIKADIEGAERQMLAGGEQVFTKKARQVWLCAYHRRDDEEVITSFLSRAGFRYEINDGYMYFDAYDDDFIPPNLRHGVIYGERA